MSNNRYVILNCPALQQTYYCNTHHSKCQDCIDCVMKQIVERCKDIKCPCSYQGADCFGCWIGGKKN